MFQSIFIRSIAYMIIPHVQIISSVVQSTVTAL